MNQTPLSCDHLFLIFFATFSNILIMNITLVRWTLGDLCNFTFLSNLQGFMLWWFKTCTFWKLLDAAFSDSILLKSQKSYHDRLFSI